MILLSATVCFKRCAWKIGNTCKLIGVTRAHSYIEGSAISMRFLTDIYIYISLLIYKFLFWWQLKPTEQSMFPSTVNLSWLHSDTCFRHSTAGKQKQTQSALVFPRFSAFVTWCCIFWLSVEKFWKIRQSGLEPSCRFSLPIYQDDDLKHSENCWMWFELGQVLFSFQYYI